MPQTVHISRNNADFSFKIKDQVELWTTQEQYPLPLKGDAFADAIYDALMHPVDYPPVTGGVVPGDAVAIVIDAELPNPEVAVTGVLRTLADLELSRIDVVVPESATEETRAAIRSVLTSEIELTVHSGKSRDDLRYLAANEAADPIYLNRRIVDADLVIPVFAARQSDPLMTGSGFCPVFPSLSDYRSQARARIDASDLTSSTHQRRGAADDEATRVGWLLGLQWLVSVEMTADGKPGDVYVGTSDTIATRAREVESENEMPGTADVVIACVEGGSQQQSLTNLLRAALVARGHASTDSSIVLVTDLDELGVIDEYAGEAYDDESYESETIEDGQREPNREPVVETVVLSSTDHARQMLSLLINDIDSTHRYLLLSNCREEEAESFGFGFVKDAEALSRLVDGNDSCIVIRHAQLASAHARSAIE